MGYSLPFSLLPAFSDSASFRLIALALVHSAKESENDLSQSLIFPTYRWKTRPQTFLGPCCQLMGEVTTRGQVPFWLRASQMSSPPSLLRAAMLPATPLPLREESQTCVAPPLTKQRLQQPTSHPSPPHSQSSYMTCCNCLYTCLFLMSPSLISCYTVSIACGDLGGWYTLTGPAEAFISRGDPNHSESVFSHLQGICFLIYWQL